MGSQQDEVLLGVRSRPPGRQPGLLHLPGQHQRQGLRGGVHRGARLVCRGHLHPGQRVHHEGNSRLYFANRCENGWVGDMYAQIPLNNKHFAYTLNLANVPCHCNAAAYFVKMPGNNAGDGDYYCDANLGNNIWCPEYDVMEGNKHTIACTLHTCNGGNGYWDSCGRGGCQTNAFNVDSRMMCPDGGCKINTAQPFVISHYQNNGQANTWMGQNGQDASFNMCNDGGYLSNMATSYDGMVFTASLWGGGGIDMGWLDGMTGCWGDCNIDGASVTFSGFELWE